MDKLNTMNEFIVTYNCKYKDIAVCIAREIHQYPSKRIKADFSRHSLTKGDVEARNNLVKILGNVDTLSATSSSQ